MSLGPAARKSEPLFILPMAAALVLAAFLGGALGLLWQASGLGDDEPVKAEGETAG